jgi:hypothetical protein
VSDRVIVAVEFASNDPDANREMKQFLANARTDQAECLPLISQRGRVSLKEYFPTSSDGTGAKFVFSRVQNGKPVIAAGDKEARFEFEVPLVDLNAGGLSNWRKVFVSFKVDKMVCKGELSY